MRQNNQWLLYSQRVWCTRSLVLIKMEHRGIPTYTGVFFPATMCVAGMNMSGDFPVLPTPCTAPAPFGAKKGTHVSGSMHTHHAQVGRHLYFISHNMKAKDLNSATFLMTAECISHYYFLLWKVRHVINMLKCQVSAEQQKACSLCLMN